MDSNPISFWRGHLGLLKQAGTLGRRDPETVAVYNFCRMHGSLQCTPGMAAGVVDRLWSMHDLYNAVTEHAQRQRKPARIERLIKRLREEGR